MGDLERHPATYLVISFETFVQSQRCFGSTYLFTIQVTTYCCVLYVVIYECASSLVDDTLY